MSRRNEAATHRHAKNVLGIVLLLSQVFWAVDPALSQSDHQNSRLLDAKRILILNAYGYAFPASIKIMPALLSALQDEGISFSNVYIEYLDLGHVSDGVQRSQLERYILDKYSDKRIDIIVTLYTSALRFILEGEKRLAPEVPVVALYGPEMQDVGKTSRKVVLLPIRMDFAGTLTHAIELFPQTKKVVFVNGSGPEDEKFLNQAKVDFAPWKGLLEFQYTTDQTLRQTVDFVRNLPEQSVIIFANYLKDKTGRAFIPQEVASRIAKSANAPTFGPFDTLLGTGVVGGSMWSFEADGVRIAKVVTDILDQSFPLHQQVTTLAPQWLPMFDWPQIERWRGEWDDLPANSVFINRPDTLWNQYRTAVISMVAAVGILTLLVVALLIQGRRRKLAEETAKASEARFRRAIEDAPAPIIIHAEDGRVLTVSRTWTEITGYTLEDIPTVADWTRRAYGPRMHMVKSYIETLYDSRERRDEGEYTVICMDGSRRTWNFYSVPIGSLPDGRRTVLSMAFDITKRKQLESDLLNSKTAAEAASQAKSEFLANMSHEVRTPLNGVLGMLQLLETTNPNLEQEEYIETAIKSTNRLTNLLSDILDISRIEAGKLQVVGSEFDMKTLWDSIEEIFRAEAKKKGLHLVFHIDKGLPHKLVGDEARLRQILFNLVGNAIKFTEKGGVHVEASLLPAISAESSVRILMTISDSGIGIADQDIKKICEPFFQVEESYSRSFQGAGLGLSIVRRLVALLGGSIAIDSAPGSGTTFYLSLPFKVSTGEASKAAAAPLVRPAKARALRILFAENDAVSLTASSLLLEKSGYSVTAAKNGQEALRLLGERDFDLILMDIQMPVMDGIEATKAIRSATDLGWKSRIPIIAMTAYAMTGDKEEFLSVGMNDYVAKPVDLAELCSTIERVAGKAADNA